MMASWNGEVYSGALGQNPWEALSSTSESMDWSSSNRIINELRKSIYDIFRVLPFKSTKFSMFRERDNIKDFLRLNDKDINFENKDIEINDDNIVYHFEKLDVIFSFESNWALRLHEISYNFPENFDDKQKCEILSRFYDSVLEKYHRIQYTVWEHTIY